MHTYNQVYYYIHALICPHLLQPRYMHSGSSLYGRTFRAMGWDGIVLFFGALRQDRQMLQGKGDTVYIYMYPYTWKNSCRYRRVWQVNVLRIHGIRKTCHIGHSNSFDHCQCFHGLSWAGFATEEFLLHQVHSYLSRCKRYLSLTNTRDTSCKIYWLAAVTFSFWPII